MGELNVYLEIDIDTEREQQLKVRNVVTNVFGRSRTPDAVVTHGKNIAALSQALANAILEAEKDGVIFKQGEAMSEAMKYLNKLYTSTDFSSVPLCIKDEKFVSQQNDMSGIESISIMFKKSGNSIEDTMLSNHGIIAFVDGNSTLPAKYRIDKYFDGERQDKWYEEKELMPLEMFIEVTQDNKEIYCVDVPIKFYHKILKVFVTDDITGIFEDILVHFARYESVYSLPMVIKPPHTERLFFRQENSKYKLADIK